MLPTVSPDQIAQEYIAPNYVVISVTQAFSDVTDLGFPVSFGLTNYEYTVGGLGSFNQVNPFHIFEFNVSISFLFGIIYYHS